MSGMVKIALSLVGVLLALLVVAIVLIKLELTPEKVRETIIPIAEEYLQRKVEVGEIKIGIFSGVSLRDVKVMQRDGSDEFVSAGLISLSYRLWPLLTGKLAIDEVRLLQPKIVVIRTPDGRFNFSDLFPEESSDDNAAVNTPVSQRQSPPEASKRAINLLVQTVAVDNGELLFIDQLQNPRSPYRYRLHQLGLQAAQITFDKPFPVKFSALLNGSEIELAGQYDLSTRSGDFDLQLAPLSLVQFAPYYREALPGTLGSASLALSIEAQFQADRFTSKGKISLEKIDLTVAEFPDVAFKQAALSLEYAVAYQADQQTLDISTLLINLNNIALGAAGKVQLAGEQPQLAVTLLLDKFDLRTLNQGLPAGLATDLKAYSLAGLVDGRIELAGRLSDGEKLLKSAVLELDNVKASVASSRVGVSGRVQYAGQVAQAEKLQVRYAEQQAQLSFIASDLLGELIRGEFQLTADLLDLNRFSSVTAAVAEVDNGPATLNRSAVKSGDSKLPPVVGPHSFAEEIGPFDLPLQLKGTLAVNRLLYKQLSLNRFNADLKITNNHLLVSNLRSAVAGGELQASADINLGVKGLAYSGQLNLGQSDLTTLVSGLFPLSKQSVSGQFQLQNNFSGRGTIADNLLRHLQLKGAVQIGNGKVVGSPLLEQFSSFLGSSELKILSFNQFSGNYRLRNGVANLAAQLDSSKLKLRPTGTVGLDGAMNMTLDARLSPALLSSLGTDKNLNRVITDAEGWGVFPLKIKGSIDQPKIGFDSVELQKLVTEKATESVTDQLLEKLGVENEAEKVPIQQMLDGALKKLFGN